MSIRDGGMLVYVEWRYVGVRGMGACWCAWSGGMMVCVGWGYVGVRGMGACWCTWDGGMLVRVGWGYSHSHDNCKCSYPMETKRVEVSN